MDEHRFVEYNVNVNKHEAFGMPPGTVRAFIAIISVMALVGMTAWLRTDVLIGALISTAGTAVAFYFGKKSENGNGGK